MSSVVAIVQKFEREQGLRFGKILPDLVGLEARSKHQLLKIKDRIHRARYKAPKKYQQYFDAINHIVNQQLAQHGRSWHPYERCNHNLTDHAFLQYLRCCKGVDIAALKDEALSQMDSDQGLEVIRLGKKVLTVWPKTDREKINE